MTFQKPHEKTTVFIRVSGLQGPAVAGPCKEKAKDHVPRRRALRDQNCNPPKIALGTYRFSAYGIPMYMIINSSFFSAVSEKRLNGMMRYGGVFGFAEWLEIHCLGFRSGFFWLGKSMMWKGKSIERYVWNLRGAFDGMKQHETQGPIHWEGKKKSVWKWFIHILVPFFGNKAALNFEQLGLSETCVPLNRLEQHMIFRMISRPWDIPWYLSRF